jgi:transketolase
MDKKLKRGDKRSDGMIFWEYAKGCINNEWWITEEKYILKKKKLYLRDLKRRKLNPEYFRSNNRRNAPKYKEKVKEYRNKNIEKFREYRKKWENKNPNNVSARIAKRRALKKLATDSTHNILIENTLRDICKRLKSCLGNQWDLDHIHPLASGGKHHHLNLQPLPHSFNCRKGMNKNFILPDCYKTIDMI